MGITVNKDGSMTITLDDNYKLPSEIITGKVNKSVAPLFEDMSDDSFTPVDLSDVDLSKFEKENLAEDIDKSLGLNQDIDTDITRFPLINKYIQGILYGIDGEGGALGMKDSYDDLIEKTKREIQAEKNLVSGSPSSRENLPENRSKYRVAPVDIFERITGLDKVKDKKENEKENDPLDVTIKVPMQDGSGQGMSLSEFIASKMKPADDDSGDKKSKDPDESKMSKFLSGLMDKDEFLMDLGLRLMQGEGLFPAGIKAAKTQKAADQTEAATTIANLLTEATIKDKLKGTNQARNAELYALTFTKDKDSPLFAKKYQEYLEMDVNKDKEDSLDLDDLSPLLIASAIQNDGQIDKELINRLLQSIMPNLSGEGGPDIEKEYITAS
tara:strand:- start:6093 stop:7244 length:1152 start_codon:yes stop_codon:yes gene_type:complete